MNKYILILAAAALSGLPATAQTSQKLTAGKASEYGLIYTLPATALDIYFEAEVSEEHPGEFHNYARRHLGINDAVTADSRQATLKSVTIVPRGIPNPDKRYMAQFKAGTTPFMLLSADNLPLSVNTEDVVAIDSPEIPEASAATPTALESPAAAQAVTAEMARSSSTSKRAELAAQRIFELRETRSDILSGQADNPPADGQAMQLVLDNLSAQEAALTAMFAGTNSSRTDVDHITIVPDSTGMSETIVARLSAVEGILPADNLAGAPITVSVKILEQGVMPVMENGATKTFPKGGVAYNIPGRALVTVNYAGRKIAEKEIALAQAGVVFGLDPKRFTDKKEPAKALFDPTTGALVELGPAN